MPKIILAGGTGFVGQYLAKQFANAGYEIIIISRQKGHVNWQDTKAVIDAIDGSEMLINLAGRSVDCRYNEKNKKEILESRTETTRMLGEAVLQCNHPPELWINSSTATIYREAYDHYMTEASGEIGTGFSVDVAKSWEKTFFDFKLPNTRQAALRISIVLGKDGGVMIPFKNLTRFGMGGSQGSGKQMFSWIHIADLFNIISFIQSNKNLSGAFNCTSPHAVTNAVLMKTFRQIMHMPIGLSIPKFLLEIGAVMIRTETELLLKSRWVFPEKLLNAGYVFEYPEIDKALNDMLTQ